MPHSPAKEFITQVELHLQNCQFLFGSGENLRLLLHVCEEKAKRAHPQLVLQKRE